VNFATHELPAGYTRSPSGRHRGLRWSPVAVIAAAKWSWTPRAGYHD